MLTLGSLAGPAEGQLAVGVCIQRNAEKTCLPRDGVPVHQCREHVGSPAAGLDSSESHWHARLPIGLPG